MPQDLKEKVRAQDIVTEALSWIGTPYKHQASCKGSGCDCLGLIRGVYSTFHEPPETPPPYTPGWADPNGLELLADAAKRYLTPVERTHLEPAHVLLFRYQNAYPAKHVGILIEKDKFLHAQPGSGVCLVSLGPWWQRRIAGIFVFPFIDT